MLIQEKFKQLLQQRICFLFKIFLAKENYTCVQQINLIKFTIQTQRFIRLHHIVYDVKRNGVIELNSLQFEKRAQWHINSVPETIEGDWADYLRGATWHWDRNIL